MITAENVDSEGTVAWKFQRRMRDLAARLDHGGDRRFDVVHQPIRPHDRFFRRVHRCPYAQQALAWQRDGASIAEPGIGAAELNAVRRRIRRAHRVHIRRYDFKIMDLHGAYGSQLASLAAT